MSSNIKRIKGTEYAYYTYYIEGKRHDVYCGPADNPKSKVRLLEAEIEYTRQQSQRFIQKTIELENKLKHIKR